MLYFMLYFILYFILYFQTVEIPDKCQMLSGLKLHHLILEAQFLTNVTLDFPFKD